MQEELKALEDNMTWSLVQLPPNRKAIGCNWVYKTKFMETRDIDKYKAHLVSKGFSQTKGIDYEETFAPVSKMSSLKTILALGASKSW